MVRFQNKFRVRELKGCLTLEIRCRHLGDIIAGADIGKAIELHGRRVAYGLSGSRGRVYARLR